MTTTTTRTLKIGLFFVDGDTRTVNIKNPRSNIEPQEFVALSNLIAQNNLLIGDKAGATFGRITSGDIVEQTRTTLDIIK